MKIPIDELIDQYARLGSAAFRGMLRRAITLIRQHDDLADLSAALPGAWKNSETLSRSLIKALPLAEMQGRAEIEQIVTPEFEEVWALPFREAIERFRQRLNIPLEEWESLSAEWREYAFWISGLTNAQLLADIRSMLERAMTEGTGYREFEQEFKEKAQAGGWEPKEGLATRARRVFDANMRTAHATGRWMQATKPHVLQRYPVWEWRHRDSPNPRLHHIAMDGNRFTAPLPLSLPSGFGCFPGHEKAATPDGWKRLDEFAIGDLVIGGSGDIQAVYSVSKRMYCGHMVRVILPADRHFSATPNHRILTLRGWIKAANLKAGDVLVQLPEVAAIDKSILQVDDTTGLTEFDMSRPSIAKRVAPPANLDRQVKFGQPNVSEANADRSIEGRSKTPGFKQVKHHLFPTGWRHDAIDVATSILSIAGKLDRMGAGADIWVKKRGSSLQFLRLAAKYFARFFRLSERPMTMNTLVLVSELYGFPSGIPSFGVANPLQGNSFTFGSRNPSRFNGSHDGSFVHAPSPRELANGHDVFEIEEPEGFTPGHPLSAFDSLDSFRAWAGRVGHLTTVVDVSSFTYQGFVYNLSVERDESYCLPHAVVHNCRCAWLPRRDDGRETVNYTLSDRLNPKTKEAERVVHVPMQYDSTGKPTKYDPNGKPTPMADPGWVAPTNRSRPEVIRGMLNSLPPDIRQRVEDANGGI